MRVGHRALVVVAVLAASSALAVGQALSAVNSVSGGRLSRSTSAITANTIKPASCNAITLANIIVGVNGNGTANLLLGSNAADVMSAGGGNDCVLGGNGNDTIACGAGTDVAIGGPGTDIFSANCETQIQ